MLTDFAPDCYVREGGHAIGTFETMSLRNNGRVLHIDHFALTSAMQGHGKGEAVLRGFALLLMEQRPGIDRITLDLGRAREGSDIEKLAKARAELFAAIGAHDIRESRPNNRRICVSAVWGEEPLDRRYLTEWQSRTPVENQESSITEGYVAASPSRMKSQHLQSLSVSKARISRSIPINCARTSNDGVSGSAPIKSIVGSASLRRLDGVSSLVADEKKRNEREIGADRASVLLRPLFLSSITRRYLVAAQTATTAAAMLAMAACTSA